MPRKVRVEYEGALYHLMSRGDRREPIFKGEKDRELFLETLGEACGRTGWVVYSYVLMGNHYHLQVATPEANLVRGMKWLQGAYTQRFNIRHKLCGHLFQGRYRALAVDPEEPEYAWVVSDYIHLNPARAGLEVVKEKGLAGYRWSSYPHFLKPEGKPEWLSVEEVMSWHHWDWRKPAERRRYANYMGARVREIGRESGGGPIVEEAYKKLRGGWALGSERFVERLEELAGRVIGSHRRESYSEDGARGHDEARSRQLLERALAALDLDCGEVLLLKKSDRRKQGVAWLLKSATTIDDRWVCERLGMGDRSNVSRAVRVFREERDRDVKRIKRKLHVCTD